ncbi:MAG: threonine synthase, partial [Flavobacteriales bacterium]|nr:threonine synthase [Flavobacteriales bacterium]
PDLKDLKEVVEGYSYSDDETLASIEDIYKRTSYLPDPHGAVAYLGLKEAMKGNDNAVGVFVETAHPAKFIETFTDEQKEKLEVPERLSKFMDKEKVSIKMDNSFASFKEYLLSR